jgi:acetoin:2,6-dichlorophenolindophenol oxidoreductase subunit beta
MRQIKLIQALREAIDEEMERDAAVCLFGEDIGAYGGVWGLSVGLQKKFGKVRVFDTPLSESAIVGTAAGAAIAGMRPVVELQYVDFTSECIDPLMNQAVKLRFMSGGQVKVPMTIVAPCGAGTSEAAHHSKTLESWFVHEPGLKVVMPSTIRDMKALLKSSIRDDNPVLFLWHKLMFDWKGEAGGQDECEPLGAAVVRRRGSDVTVVAYSLMAQRALEAAERLGPRVAAEVIDLRTLNPLDLDCVLESVRKTGRLLVVHESPGRCGIGRDLAAQVVDREFRRLKSAPVVLAGADLPIPFARTLETACIPQVEGIVRAIETLVCEGVAA